MSRYTRSIRITLPTRAMRISCAARAMGARALTKRLHERQRLSGALDLAATKRRPLTLVMLRNPTMPSVMRSKGITEMRSRTNLHAIDLRNGANARTLGALPLSASGERTRDPSRDSPGAHVVLGDAPAVRHQVAHRVVVRRPARSATGQRAQAQRRCAPTTRRAMAVARAGASRLPSVEDVCAGRGAAPSRSAVPNSRSPRSPEVEVNVDDEDRVHQHLDDRDGVGGLEAHLRTRQRAAHHERAHTSRP